MDFISFISKMTALGYTVSFVPTFPKAIAIQVRRYEDDVNTGGVESIIPAIVLANPESVAYQLAYIERTVMQKLGNQNK